MYRWVVVRAEWPASIWTSLKLPPTVDIRRAHAVIAVLRPEWLEQPIKLNSEYQLLKRLAIAVGDVLIALSVAMTKGDGLNRLFHFNSRRELWSSLFKGITRPERPLEAWFTRWIDEPILPSASDTISQLKHAISFALNPARIDRINITRLRIGYRVFDK